MAKPELKITSDHLREACDEAVAGKKREEELRKNSGWGTHNLGFS